MQAGQILQFAGWHESVAGAGNAQARPDGPHVLDGLCIRFGRGAVDVHRQALALGTGTKLGHQFRARHPSYPYAVEHAGTDTGADAVGDEQVGLLQQLADVRIMLGLHGLFRIHRKDKGRPPAGVSTVFDQLDAVVRDLVGWPDDDILVEEPGGSQFAGHGCFCRFVPGGMRPRPPASIRPDAPDGQEEGGPLVSGTVLKRPGKGDTTCHHALSTVSCLVGRGHPDM